MLQLSRMKIDFIAIGDPVVDDFIRIKDASVHCDINSEQCTICMRWGDKIPFESSTLIAGVGNSANAAVSAQRLGLSSALVGIIGKDEYGKEILKVYKKEGLSTAFIEKQNIPTNHHYVLWYESERTILIKHEDYKYVFPKLPKVKTLYLSSLAEHVGDEYYAKISEYLERNPDTILAFQPGTFQIKMGVEKLKRIYERSNIFFCNDDEARRILKSDSTSISELLDGLKALGPKIAVITEGTKGAHAYDGSQKFSIPMYPDPRAPFERTGAGDAFASTVAAALTLGKPLEEALLWGPINSMSVVQDIGAQRGLLSREKLESYLQQAPQTYTVQPL